MFSPYFRTNTLKVVTACKSCFLTSKQLHRGSFSKETNVFVGTILSSKRKFDLSPL